MMTREPPQLAAARLRRQAKAEAACGGTASTASTAGSGFALTICQLLRPENANDCMRQIVAALHRPLPEKPDDDVTRLLDNCLGHLPRGSMTVQAEAKLLGLDRTKLPDLIEEMAAMTYFCNSLVLDGLASNISAKIEADELEPVCVIHFHAFDETPMPLRVGEKFVASTASSSTAIVAHVAPSRRHRRTTTTTKLLQVEQTEAFMVRSKKTSEYMCIFAPHAVPVLPMAECKGETLCQALEHRLALSPVWQAFAAKFDLQIALSLCDGASSNKRYEAGMLALLPSKTVERLTGKRKTKTRLRMLCVVHMLSNVVGRVYSALSTEISGMIALCLASRASGAISQLRRALVDTIKASVLIQKCEPATEPSPRLVALLDLCIPHTGSGAVHKYTLLRVITGDIESDDIIWCTTADKPDVDEYSETFVEAVLPGSIGMFARHRWLTTISPLKLVTLLDNLHHLLRRAGPLWIAYMRGKNATPAAVSKKRARSTLWDPPSDDSDAQHPKAKKARKKKPTTSVGLATKDEERQEIDWAAVNEQRRGDTLTFVNSGPGEKCLIATVCLDPCVQLMRLFEEFASRAWELEHSAACCQGERVVTRMEFAHSGGLTSQFFSDMAALMQEGPAWDVVASGDMTVHHNGLAFSMLSSAICGVKAMIAEQHDGFPFALWSLLGPDSERRARTISRTRKCMFDAFTRDFVEHFKGRLGSKESRTTLHAIGLLLRIEITRLECRNAVLRRLVRKWQSSWKRSVEGVSADFLLLTQRILENLLATPKADIKKPSDPSAKQKRVIGGNPHRAHMHNVLGEAARGKNSSEDRSLYLKEAWQEYRAVKEAGGPEFDKLVKQGAAGNSAVRAGGSAFGSRPSRRSHAEHNLVADAIEAVAALRAPAPAALADIAAQPAEAGAVVAVDVGLGGGVCVCMWHASKYKSDTSDTESLPSPNPKPPQTTSKPLPNHLQTTPNHLQKHPENHPQATSEPPPKPTPQISSRCMALHCMALPGIALPLPCVALNGRLPDGG